MTKDETLKQALNVLKGCLEHPDAQDAIYSIEAALAQPVPVALPCCGYADSSAIQWNPYNQVVQCHNCGQSYTSPPQRKPLTVHEIGKFVGTHGFDQDQLLWFRLGEAAHGIKGDV